MIADPAAGMQVYILLLWDCKVGLLGLGYLALLILVFTYPPIRGRWKRLDEGGVAVNGSHPASSSGMVTLFLFFRYGSHP